MVTRPPAAFGDEQLDAALLSVLGEPGVAADGALGSAASSPRAGVRSLAGSRRASATLGIAGVGAIAGLAFLTLARDDAPDSANVRAVTPRQRVEATGGGRALAGTAPAPVASTMVVAVPASPPRPVTRPRPLPAVAARTARPLDRRAGREEVTRRPAVVLTDLMVGVAEPATIAISAPAAPQSEPMASMVVDPAPPAEATALDATTQRARRDSVRAIRSFRRQW